MNLTMEQLADLFVRCATCGEATEGFAGTCPSCGAELMEVQA